MRKEVGWEKVDSNYKRLFLEIDIWVRNGKMNRSLLEKREEGEENILNIDSCFGGKVFGRDSRWRKYWCELWELVGNVIERLGCDYEGFYKY